MFPISNEEDSLPRLTLESAVVDTLPIEVETFCPETVKLESAETEVLPIDDAEVTEDKNTDAFPVTGMFVSIFTVEDKLGTDTVTPLPVMTEISPIAGADDRLGAIPVPVILTFVAPKVAVEDKDNEERSTLQVPVTVGLPTAVDEAIVLTVTDST